MNEFLEKEPALPPETIEPLDREVWEGISIKLLGLDAEERFDTLDRLEIDPAHFDASEVHWCDEMMREIVAGDRTAAERYGARCAEELERRKQAGPEAHATSVEGPRPGPGEELRAPLAPPGNEVPTFMQGGLPEPVLVARAPAGPAPPAIVSRPGAGATMALDTTSLGGASVGRTMPFVAPKPGDLPIARTPAAAAPRPHDQVDPLDRTAETPDAINPGPVLPFTATNEKEGK
jgi:hypothetical protein